MKVGVFSILLGSASLLGAGQQPTAHELARKQEAAACTPCHSLRLVHIQRLSAAAWNKELDKMIGWGAVVPDRKLLVEYLAEEYSDRKPISSPEISTDGTRQKSR